MVEPFRIPDNCPVCGGPTLLDGDFLYCRSKSCPARLTGAVHVWVRNLGLLHWGDALVENITDQNNPKIKSVADLYNLSVDDLATCCSGVKVAQKCHDILHENKSITLELMLASLNIPNFGLSTATDVVQAGFDTIEKVLNIDYDKLMEVPNIGKKTAIVVLEGLQMKRDLILELEQVLDIKPPVVGGAVQGKSFCITGDLSKSRKTVEKMILDQGGFAKSSVSKTTSYLVTNDSNTTSSKMQKAKKYGVPVIDEAALYAMLGC